MTWGRIALTTAEIDVVATTVTVTNMIHRIIKSRHNDTVSNMIDPVVDHRKARAPLCQDLFVGLVNWFRGALIARVLPATSRACRLAHFLPRSTHTFDSAAPKAFS